MMPEYRYLCQKQISEADTQDCALVYRDRIDIGTRTPGFWHPIH